VNRRVLLVEDEHDARDVLARAFERAGWRCAQAFDVPTALAALAAAEGAPFDAAVVDLVLGKNDRGGIELVPRIRAASIATSIVVITAFADMERVKRVLNDGASYLLEKPFRAQELLDVVARLVEGRDSVAHLVDRALLRAKLTDKEAQIARLLLKGLPTAEIARLEGNSDKTIRQHVSQVYAKCGVSTRAEFFHYVFPT
jgi:DNA-binding NarL/FixJ family response regulator